MIIPLKKPLLTALVLAGAMQAVSFAQTAVKPKPLVTDLFTADPSAHVFNGRIYIYPSHDIEANVPQDDEGGHFNMRDYHVYSMDKIGGPVTDHGVGLDLKDIPWAGRQLWAPDAAYRNGTYYLYFPVKDKEDVFRIGVATSKSPTGPFKPEPKPIPGSYSIDPAVFTDQDGKSYMYFGGIWGGQLQRWHTGKYDASLKTDLGEGHESEPALTAKVARMKGDMLTFDEAPKNVEILTKTANRSWQRTTTGASSKEPGCTGSATNTTSPTRRATRISSPTPWGARHTGHLPTKASS